jgi:hypothetical protein
MFDDPIHITVPDDPNRPWAVPPAPEGVIVHRVPALHPDDVTVIAGIPVTSVSRTLIDQGEYLSLDELRACFARARANGLLDLEALAAARARVEWRPSLAMVDQVIAEFS